MSVRRRAAKRDRNEADIIQALVAVGATVAQVSEGGLPDLLVGFRGHNYLIEVKAERGKLTPEQFDFFERWRGHCDVARTVEDALRIIGAIE